MLPAPEDPSHKHQVGITNAQEKNADAWIAAQTALMNAKFLAKEYAEAARMALEITAKSKGELRDTFVRHGVSVLHLDHEAFGIYQIIEPSYDLHVDGMTPDVLAAAEEFGSRHAQEAVLIARKLQEGETDPAERLGLVVVLREDIKIEEAIEIVEVVRDCGFTGATFVLKRGEVSIYHTDDLGMTREQFKKAADFVAARLQAKYTQAQYTVAPYLVLMPSYLCQNYEHRKIRPTVRRRVERRDRGERHAPQARSLDVA